MGKQFVLIVMDSVGIGALPDADRFGDEGSDYDGTYSTGCSRIAVAQPQ